MIVLNSFEKDKLARNHFSPGICHTPEQLKRRSIQSTLKKLNIEVFRGLKKDEAKEN